MVKLSRFFRHRLFIIYILVGCSSFSFLSADEYNIIPYPRTLIPQTGSFTFNKRTTLYCPFNQPEVLKLVQQFSAQFELVSGVKLAVVDIANAKAENAVIFQPEVNLENA